MGHRIPKEVAAIVQGAGDGARDADDRDDRGGEDRRRTERGQQRVEADTPIAGPRRFPHAETQHDDHGRCDPGRGQSRFENPHIGQHDAQNRDREWHDYSTSIRAVGDRAFRLGTALEAVHEGESYEIQRLSRRRLRRKRTHE